MAQAKISQKQLPKPNKLILGLLVALAFSLVGAYLLRGSDAATPTYHQLLNYSARSQTAGVTDIQAQVNSLGAQTVSTVEPGAQLDYQVGGKTLIKNQCYYYSITPNKGGGETAKIQFVGQGSAVTINVTYSPENAGFWRKTCVGKGTQTQKAYNVANLSAPGGPNVLVYQDDLSF